MKFLKTTQLTLVLLASAYAGSVLAVTANIPSLTATTGVAATTMGNYDVWHVTCGAGTTGLKAAVGAATAVAGTDTVKVTFGTLTTNQNVSSIASVAPLTLSSVFGAAGYSVAQTSLGGVATYDIVVSHTSTTTALVADTVSTYTNGYNVIYECVGAGSSPAEVIVVDY